MFIAHLPAGYIVARCCQRRYPHERHLVLTGLVASVLPDTDLLWFYLVDQRQTPHHEYLFHWPMFWIGMALIAWLATTARGKTALHPYIFTALASLLVHLFLDSMASTIHWLRPFSEAALNIVTVPARYDWWVWNFVWHWTFLTEIIICLVAAVLFYQSHQSRAKTAAPRP